MHTFALSKKTNIRMINSFAVSTTASFSSCNGCGKSAEVNSITFCWGKLKKCSILPLFIWISNAFCKTKKCRRKKSRTMASYKNTRTFMPFQSIKLTQKKNPSHALCTLTAFFLFVHSEKLHFMDVVIQKFKWFPPFTCWCKCSFIAKKSFKAMGDKIFFLESKDNEFQFSREIHTHNMNTTFHLNSNDSILLFQILKNFTNFFFKNLTGWLVFWGFLKKKIIICCSKMKLSVWHTSY